MDSDFQPTPRQVAANVAAYWQATARENGCGCCRCARALRDAFDGDWAEHYRLVCEWNAADRRMGDPNP